MKTFKRARDRLRAMTEKVTSCVKSLLIIGLIGASLVSVSGCSALDPRRMCEEELAETRAKLAQTSQLANSMETQLQAQRAELIALKRHNAESVRREKEQALDQIEAKRQQLEEERYEVNRIRQLEQAELEQ